MSSYKGLLLSFEINPQPLPRFWFLLLCVLLPCGVLMLSISSIYKSTFSLLPFSLFSFSLFILSLCTFYAFYFYWTYRCYQEFVRLSRPESPRAISCQQGLWEILFYNGKLMQKLCLADYYLNSHFIVLHFLVTEKSATEKFAMEKLSTFKPWQGKKTVMIFPAQLGEEKFRLLFRLLKFQNQGIKV